MATTIYDTQFTNQISGIFGAFFSSGTSPSTSDVPWKYNVALDGRGFMVDGAPHGFYVRGEPTWHTVPTLRSQQDTREVGELSLNSEGLWRRSASSWELGAGQVVYDDQVAVRQRFRSSKGIDIWTRGQVSLLNDTAQLTTVSGSASTVQMVSTAAHVYWADLNTVVRSDLTTQTNVTGTPATAITSLVSVGSYVLVGYTSTGVYKIVAGASTGAAWMTDAVTPSVVGWAKGRVIVTVGAAVYNPITAFTSSAALPTPLWTHPDAAFTWVGVAEGTSWIYLGGTSGDKSTIYKTGVKADGTALDVPSVAGRLPDGETLTTIYGYLGVLIFGTTRGFRLATANTSGDLTIGALVDLGVAVNAMRGRGHYIYFGWSNYDATSTGIGRLNLAALTDTSNLVPAYASDLMATTQGTVNGIAYLSNQFVFSVNTVGIYKQSTTDFVPSGTFDTGIIRYSVTENKVVTGAQSSYTGSGTVTMQLATNGGTFTAISDTGTQSRGINYELRVTITRSSATVAPTLQSITMYAYPAPQATMLIDVAVIVSESLEAVDGSEQYMDIVDTLAFFRDRWLTKKLVTYQEGLSTWSVTLEDFKFQAMGEAKQQRGAWSGTAFLNLKVIS